MVRVWRIAGSSSRRHGRTRQQTQIGWVSSRKNRPIWLRRNGATFGVSGERARSILVSTIPVVPCPSLDDLRDVCGSFSAHTATGSDNLHPVPHLKHVCVDALRATAMITTLAANFGYCLAVFAIIMVLLPKATCGWRPIGLFTSVLRVYLRWTRTAGTSSWERGFSRP